MAIRRVFIFWTHPLFHDAVRAMLSHPDIVWVGSSENYAVSWDYVESCAADTIVVEEVEGKTPLDIMLQCLDQNEHLIRIMGLNLQDNQARMYHRIQRAVGKADDLLDWILKDYQEGECQ